MRHKTITLCPTTYEIAKKMPNFSKWIRETLLAYQDGETLTDAIRQRQYWKDKAEGKL
jgi:hypothetical protein